MWLFRYNWDNKYPCNTDVLYLYTLSNTHRFVRLIHNLIFIYILVVVFEVWCLTPLSTIFQLYRTRRKPLTCCKSLTNLITCFIEYTPPWAGFELTLVVICTDCIGSCKSNYHMIMTAMVFDDEELYIKDTIVPMANIGVSQVHFYLINFLS